VGPPPSPAPPVPGASLLDDPAYEPTVISIPPRVHLRSSPPRWSSRRAARRR
jgi:hypothetical protein